jgi:hypothetical protein
MFPALQFAMLALGAASCPSNLANDLATPAPAASGQRCGDWWVED